MDIQLFRTKNLAMPSKIPSGNIWMIGNFDGVHKGHQSLINIAKSYAQKDCDIGLLTFHPHPKQFFAPSDTLFYIQSFGQKLMTLKQYGVKYCYAYPFDSQTACLSAEDFCRNILFTIIKPRGIIVGYDFHFGKNRQGNIEFLKKMGEKYNFDVHIAPQLNDNKGAKFGSHQLRSAIKQGDLEGIHQITGRPYQITGRVIHGRKLGRTIGFPTANIHLKNIIHPKYGVYSGFVMIDSKQHKAIANIGIRPTIYQNSMVVMEIHILNHSQDLYESKIEFTFEKFIREEKKFKDINDLKLQIKKDIQRA